MTADPLSQMQQEVVEFLQVMPPPPARWPPTVGPETFDVLQGLKAVGLSEDEVATVRNEAIQILSRCVSPRTAAAKSTGIAIGRVQSGKTTSFTALASLAVDNGFPLVVVLGGTKNNLFNQSEDRLTKALRLQTRGPLEQKWLHFSNPTDERAEQVRTQLSKWLQHDVPEEEKRGVLLTVMKHHKRIGDLSRMLSGMADVLEKTPVLVIDDEADEAGLNAQVNKGRESTTYSRILEMRRRLTWHSYVQYTATPQAPLLISIIDMLSPEFPVVLTPGEAYTGGERFFGNSSLNLVRDIPSDDLVNPNDTDDKGPPESLQEALRVFFVGVAAGRMTYQAHRRGPAYRSMMVHPSQRVSPHREFVDWINMIKRRWVQELNDHDDPAHEETAEQFHEAWKDLAETVDDIPSFDEILKTLSRRIEETVVSKVNTDGRNASSEVDWKASYSHILVGGNSLNRGFTVEGLTVTYMPRGKGEGNADTVQQRARFFGYKKAYLGYCRVYLEEETRKMYQAYIAHENDILRQMKKLQADGKSLKDWKRAFLLDKGLKATRDAVIRDLIVRENFASSWWNPKGPNDSDEAIGNNRALFEAFQERHKKDWVELNPGKKWTLDETPLVVRNLQLSCVMEDLLARLEMPRISDSHRYTSLQLQLQHFLENVDKDLRCDVYLMSKGRTRDRGVEENEVLKNIFMGSNATTDFPGDRKIFSDGGVVTIQLHLVNVTEGENPRERVPVVAVRVPEELSADFLVQVPKEDAQ